MPSLTEEVSYFTDPDAMSNYNSGVDSAASDGNTSDMVDNNDSD